MLTLRKCGHRDLEKYYSIFGIDFDSEELFNRLVIHKGMMAGEITMFVFVDEESKIDVGYAVLLTNGVYGYVLLKYFAIFPWYRGKGFGKQAMMLMKEYYSNRQGILLEITEFPDPDPDHQKKLFRFFGSIDFKEVAVDYQISGTKAHVMVLTKSETDQVEIILHRIILDFYRRVLPYGTMERMIEIRP